MRPRRDPVPIRLGKVYRANAKRREQKKRVHFRLILVGATGVGVLIGLGLIAASGSFARQGSAMAAETRQHFSICGAVRHSCVVDGDTFWLNGVRIRVADIDTPEISEPRCNAEYALGIRARDRFRDLLSEGAFIVVPIGGRDEDQYGRKLRVVLRDGASLGDQLVAEGLARTWTGRREPWC